MGDIFMIGNLYDQLEYNSSKLNLDELFEKNKQKYERKKNIYIKIMQLIHKKIKETAKYKHCLTYEIPDFIIGLAYYNNEECIAFVLNELEKNKFLVRYIYPSSIFITWAHWVPSFLRHEIKYKHGININEFGEIIEKENDDNEDQDTNYDKLSANPTKNVIAKNPASGLFMEQNKLSGQNKQQNYKSTSEYKPIGIYNPELLMSIKPPPPPPPPQLNTFAYENY